MSKSAEPVLPEIDEDLYPDVDIFIATCGEPVEILRRTLNGCVRMEYPDKSKVHIYLCDDKQKEKKEIFSNGIPVKKSSKKLKEFSMEELATYMGVSYFSRKERKRAKAGNLNNALAQTKLKGKASPIIVTFDADIVPMHDFLMQTVPFFLMNEQAKKNGEDHHRRLRHRYEY